MAVEHADNAIESFLELEQRFDDFVRAVPIAPEHNRVHSPLLASILLDACSLIETVLKSSMDNARYNALQRFDNVRFFFRKNELLRTLRTNNIVIRRYNMQHNAPCASLL